MPKRSASTPAAPYPVGTAWDRPGFLLWHATLRWQRGVAEALKPLGLTHVQFVLLAGTVWLEAHGDAPPIQRTLAEHAGIDVMMTSQVVRNLERRGLLSREPDRNDARVKRVCATREGRGLAVQAVDVVERVDDRFFGTGATRARIVRDLRELVHPEDG